jgi:pimeloyl-ACP methyl ester carboxylesterase
MKVIRGFLFSAGAILVLAAIAFYFRPLDFYDDFTYLEQVLHGVQSRFIYVDGFRIHYEVAGSANGEPVVLIHGLGGRAENWRALGPRLAKAGYRVYMPDLVGYGRSDKPQTFSYSIRDEAEIVTHFLNTMGVQQADLGGWSMGGWIAQVVAATHPGRIRRLILFDSAGLYALPDWDTRLFTPINLDQLNKLNALLMPHPPSIPGFIAADILRETKESNWVVSRAMALMLSGHDVTDAMLPQLRMPVLIEWGAQDQIIPVNQAVKMHRLVPQSDLHTYGGCGHLAPLQCADALGADVVSFLKQATGTNAPPAPSITGKPGTKLQRSPQHERLQAVTSPTASNDN